MENKLDYFEYNEGPFQELVSIIVTNNVDNVSGIKKTYVTNYMEETDQYGNKKTNCIENVEELLKEKVQEIYDYVLANIDLFKSLAIKNTLENALETGTISNIIIKYDTLELKINMAIDEINEEEIDMLNNLYIMISSI